MAAAGVRRIVYSSSAAVYGAPAGSVVDELAPTAPLNPYGRSKLAGEWIVEDASRAHGWGAVSLRYFNVVGTSDPSLADGSGSNLFPRVLAALASGTPPVVYGTDYPTRDGSCVRDYIHVGDLASAHLAALEATAAPGYQVSTSAAGAAPRCSRCWPSSSGSPGARSSACSGRAGPATRPRWWRRPTGRASCSGGRPRTGSPRWWRARGRRRTPGDERRSRRAERAGGHSSGRRLIGP